MAENQNPVPSGADIEDALDILNENGGVGEWERPEGDSIPRWLFPRFPGAQHMNGLCADHEGLHNQDPEAPCTDFIADPGNMYLSRAGIGDNDTDVETLVAWAAAPRNVVGGIMLLSAPGTGKTAVIEAAATHADATLVTHLCTPDDTRESLFLRYVGEGNGEDGTPFVKGSLAMAASIGAWYYMDEYMLLPDGVKPVTYQLSDGRHVLSGGNIDGSDLIIHPDFRFFVSSNPQVRGASMPEPVASRFASTTLHIETSAALLRDLGIEEAVVAAWEALGTANLWRPQVRELRMADYWLGLDPTQAASAFLPEHCPESQREAVRNCIISFLGGNLRTDGRLVVS